jgi:hypothetical protein
MAEKLINYCLTSLIIFITNFHRIMLLKLETALQAVGNWHQELIKSPTLYFLNHSEVLL